MHDGHEQPPYAPTAAAEACEPIVVSCEDLRAVRRALAQGGPVGSGVDLPLRVVCERAHAAGIRAEQLLVQVKRAWRQLPEVRRVEALASRDEELDSLVSALIEQFYRTPNRRSA